MGVVHRATDLQMGREVAVKLLPPGLAQDTNLLARFKNEIVNTGQLDHPHIAKIYDMGEVGGAYYYVMELVEGTDLRAQLVARGRYPLEDACSLLAEAASALDHAHARGIIHRDIKPENVLIDADGSVRIVDFGIARAAGATRMTGGMIGTPEYMSPEQARGDPTGGASDQYSLAVMAYEILTGLPPFQTDASEPWAIVNKHITEDPPDPCSLVEDLPRSAGNALLRALEKSPEDRFATCQQFVDALKGDFAFRRRRRRPKAVNRVKTRLIAAAVALLSFSGLALVVMPAWTGSHSTDGQNKRTIVVDPKPADPLSEAAVRSFVQKTWFPAWKSDSERSPGPLQKCYDTDAFVGHDYSSRTSYTTLAIDSYLSEWLSEPNASAAQLGSVVVKPSDAKHATVDLAISGAGAVNAHKRLTITRRPDGTLAVVREDSAPSAAWLGGAG